MARAFRPALLAWYSGLGCALLGIAPGVVHATAAPPAQTLDIEEFAVDGNSALPTEAVEEAVYPFLGPASNQGNIERARLALQKLYHDKGYQAVQVVALDHTPDSDGVIHFRVLEVTLGRVRIVGARYFLPSEIRKEMPAIHEGAQFNTIALAQELGVANSIPGRVVTPIPKPSRTPGAINLDLVVHDQLPVHASIEEDNAHARFSTPLRVTGSVSYENLFQRGHSLSVSYIASPQNQTDSKVLILGYDVPFIGTPYGIKIGAIQSNSAVASVSNTNIISNGSDVSVRGTANLRETDAYSQNVEAGADYKDYRANTDVAGNVSNIPVTYFPLYATYTGIAHGPHHLDVITAMISATPPRVGSNEPIIDMNRPGARGQQVYFRGGLDATQDIGAGFKIHGKINAQVSNEPLISNEQFPLGGSTSVRGYYEAESPVDNGYSATLEAISPSFPDLLASLVDTRDIFQDVRILGFFDEGGGYNRAPLAGVPYKTMLASVGLAANASLFDHVDGSLTWAMPLITDGSNPPATLAHSQEILFRVATEY